MRARRGGFASAHASHQLTTPVIQHPTPATRNRLSPDNAKAMMALTMPSIRTTHGLFPVQGRDTIQKFDDFAHKAIIP